VILVDSSVWIDFFRNRPTAQAEWLDRNLGVESFIVGDLILAEVLQGFKYDKGFNEAKRMLGELEQAVIGGTATAIEAARHFRQLRRKGITVRGTVDILIATRCIQEDWRLLHSDRDFDAFASHLGLRTVACEA